MNMWKSANTLITKKKKRNEIMNEWIQERKEKKREW